MAYPDRPIPGIAPKEGTNFLSHLVPAGIYLNQGEINRVEVVADPGKRLYVKRERDELKLADTLRYCSTVEYPALGFLQNGGKIWSRSMKEMARHMETSAALGLKTAKPVYVDDQTLVYPFTPGDNLRVFLNHDGDVRVIDTALATVADAHNRDIIHGERHPANIIVDGDDVTHVDFDHAIGGTHAKELEVALLLYPMLGHTPRFEGALERVSQFAEAYSHRYDWHVVTDFMEKFQSYLTEHPIGRNKKLLVPRLGEKLDIATASLLRAAA